MARTKIKTPIVYYGGKTSILDHLMQMVPEHEVYTETFFGGGSLFWEKDAVKNETINDKLNVVINFYRVLRTDYKKLKRMIDSSLVSRSLHAEALSTIRIHGNGLQVDRITLAWAFWLCTNFAFSNKLGGGYKYSNHQSTSVPKTMLKRKREFTEALVTRIENAYIENDDALNILDSRNVEKAFHYIDPPYPNADQGHYKGYTFTDYERLLNWCATECKGKFLLSSYNTDMLDTFTKAHHWSKKEITIRIGGDRKMNARLNRENRTEVLISNYRSACGTLELFKTKKK
jgi:DNA adenine methylase